MTSISFAYLEEPKLQFGQYFEHQDAKTGLAEFGPFGQNVDGLHPSEIKLGFIGTRETIAGAKEWIDACSRPIPSAIVKNVLVPGQQSGGLFGEEGVQEVRITRLEKILHRDFVGFNRDSPFRSCFQMNARWDRAIPSREIDTILVLPDKAERIRRLVQVFDDHMESLAGISPSPDIVVLALTQEMASEADTVPITGRFHLNFHRAIKACAMRRGIATQLLQRRSVLGTDKSLQDIAARAWNFCTAQYYKADGVPWRPATLEQDACFIGISFYVAQESTGQTAMRVSVALAFDYLGQGLVLRGDPFAWKEETHGKSLHLTHEAASKLVADTLKAYVKVRGVPPRRVVIHKSSEFWGREHGQYDELDGFNAGIDAVYPQCARDLVALRQGGIRLFREGQYPPLRGTYFSLADQQHFLYTTGFVPYLETYPGSYVPEPWRMTDHHGDSAPKDLFREMLALTKLNVNNASFADGAPITLSFARKIGEIMQHVDEDGTIQPKYKYYM